jgi:hypothetical protein
MENIDTIPTSNVSKKIADKTIISWLDYKKIDSLQREEQEAQIKAMSSYVENGDLILNEDFTFKHILKFPLGDEGKASVTELTYKARLRDQDLSHKLSMVKSDDGDGRLLAHIEALTGEVKGIIKALDKEDIKIARSIAVFFL